MFDVSGLSAYVANNSKEIVTKAVAGAITAKLLIDNKAVQTGVKGQAAILKMDADVFIQDGSACGRNPLGTTTLSNKIISVKPLKDEQNFCPKTLWGSFYATMLTAGQNPSEDLTAAFAQQIMDFRAKKIANANEKLLWQGDTTITGTSNLKYIDGIAKQAAASGVSVVATGSTITAKLQEVFFAVPVEVRQSEDFRIFVGQDVFDSYVAEIAARNLFKPIEDSTLFGTSAKIVATPGLNGLGKAYAIRISNLQLGLDMEGDADSAVIRYSTENDMWYQDFKFSVGVAVVFPEQTYFAQVA